MPYIFKHWLSVLFVSPIIADILNYYYSDTRSIIFFTSILPISFIIGLIFSLPTYVLIAIIYKFLEKRTYTILISKTIITVVSILGIIISFYIVFKNQEPNMCLGYVLTSTFFGYFYNLEISNDDNN